MATAALPTTISKGGNFETNHMKPGINPAVITESVLKQIPDFEDKTKLNNKLVTRFVNAKGEEATRFYSLSFHEKSDLAKDLIGMGIYESVAAIPQTVKIEDVVKMLVGRQCVAVTTVGKPDKNGKPKAKIVSVTGPMDGQNVVPPARGAAAPAKPATKRATAPPPPPDDGTEISDEDIPF